MRRYVSGIMVLFMLAGCATTQPLMPSSRATLTESQSCADEAHVAKTGTGTKALIYASNVLVVPLTLGIFWVHPMSDDEHFGHVYESCMARLGYTTKR